MDHHLVLNRYHMKVMKVIKVADFSRFFTYGAFLFLAAIHADSFEYYCSKLEEFLLVEKEYGLKCYISATTVMFGRYFHMNQFYY